ncbi:peptidoglycan editing factor PgeF [Facklamia sp. DSM 111018]|uniref:Purine nucleoside phosphorylase n=1 Tax=Facklamia lactis TaxID=2749967 RepID=A0ABS0LT22_9LACT|nr:peptidoglycan editing factor PgeF [Facklamia lactis]MBG9981417.1 peptidoglycan editing factor PgeF [Facklamia lactis]MBG9987107.1 peptidoglycan editing factor PgeF [Facklamia lactis]
MVSTLLEEKGLQMFLAGIDFGFRATNTSEEEVGREIDRALSEGEFNYNEVYTCNQVHGCRVEYADGISGQDYIVGKTFPETDGLMTDHKGIVLMVKIADCTPVVLFDPQKKVQAIVHSGWRSTVKGISIQALRKMQKQFDCQLQDIFAYVGPSIDQSNYEVGREVYEAFESFEDRDRFFKAGQHSGKYLLSMQQANVSLLKRAGLLNQQIEVSQQSTFTDARLHSARREGNNYQCNGLFTMIR